MSTQLNIAKKRVIEYETSGWFNHGGTEAFHSILEILGVGFTMQDTTAPEYDMEFEVERDSIEEAIEVLHAIDRREEVEDVDIDDLCRALDNESMTLAELIDCLEFIKDKSDQNNSAILISFF